MTPRTRRYVLLGIVLLLIGTTTIVGVAVRPFVLHTTPPPTALGAGSATETSSAPPLPDGHGPRVPRHGAYVGAWVEPQRRGDPGSWTRAVQRFESNVGRRLDVVNLFRRWHEDFPDATERHLLRTGHRLMFSWGGGNLDTRVILSGADDALIRSRARRIKALHAPVFMRWRWEMDRTDLRAKVWSPADYIAAWRHVRTIFAQVGTDNVSWVWCPTGWGFRADQHRRATSYYPGDDQVDWLCVDSYQQNDTQSLADGLRPFMSWARRHHKPIMIGEFGALAKRGRPAWLRQAGRYVRHTPQIKALLYFNSNGWDANRQQTDHWSLRGSRASQRAFGSILARPYFNPRHRSVRRHGTHRGDRHGH